MCPGCSTGCNLRIEENQDRVYRLKPRANPEVNHWWICDEGRYGFKHIHDPGRLSQLRVRDGGRPVGGRGLVAVAQRIGQSLEISGSNRGRVISPS